MSDHWGPVQDGATDEPESPDENQAEGDDGFSSSQEIDDWGGGELEEAYLKAMSALEASDLALPVETPEIDVPIAKSGTGDSDHQPVSPRESLATKSKSGSQDLPSIRDAANPPVELLSSQPKVSLTEPEPAQLAPTNIPLTPREILEACLFVGGNALTASRLAGVLRGDFDSEFVDREIDELNRLYAAQSRPYEIRLGDGGYRLTLREEFEKIRHKVYGLGPKEVRLSQEALEVLAVVAYHQPMKQSRVEEMGKPGCGAVLRQLVRRELLAVERDPAQPRDVNYKTTRRFLSLFGIRSLEELPRSEQVSYK